MKEILYIIIASGIYLGCGVIAWILHVLIKHVEFGTTGRDLLFSPGAILAALTWPISMPFYFIKFQMGLRSDKKKREKWLDETSELTGLSPEEIDMLYRSFKESKEKDK